MEKNTLEKMSKRELLELARKMDLPGRSRMVKSDLVEAIARMKDRVGSVERRKKKRESAIRSEIADSFSRTNEFHPEMLQQEVEEEKYDLGLLEEGPAPEAPLFSGDIPSGYSEDRIVLMVRDPFWIYAYWEIQRASIEKTLEQHDLAGQAFQNVLRVYCGDESDFQDIEVGGTADNWYINIGRPNSDFFADVGLRVQGKFLPIVRSNRVHTPRAGMSEVVDEEWMTLPEEAQKIYALSGGGQSGLLGESSAGIQERMEKQMALEVSSGGISSFFGSGRFREKPRGFWFQLDAELIVYGATEPDARVTLQGDPIQLRPDGTFTARFALPDGQQIIPVTFESADEVDRATVTPKVLRQTESS